jgi:acyl-CoA hydrolase
MSETQKEHGIHETRVEMTEVVLPQFTNSLGNVFGGQIVSWIDICAAVAAQRHCRQVVVTASIDELHFIEPVKQGDVVILKGQINAAFNTSMEIGVTVDSEDPLTGERRKAVKAYLTYVALDRHGRPQKVPSLVLKTDEDKRRNTEAKERRQSRLNQRAERIKSRKSS